jgi:hypothetical protein
MTNKLHLFFVLCFLGLIASSCGTSKSGQTRGYAYSNKKTPTGYGAYAYVLIPSGYSTTSGPKYDRMLHTANAFLDNFLLPSNFNSTKNKGDIMVTHWILKSGKPVKESGIDLLAQYDYQAALSMLTAIKMSGKQGPVLVAWKKPYERLDKNELKQCLIFDLSRFSNEDIDRAFKLWRDMLSEDVDDWNKSKNKLVKFKEEVRNMFQQYGQTLIDLLTIIY